MRLILYSRISDPSKQADGYSYAYQEKRLRGFCQLYGHEIVDEFQEGESAKSVHGRPKFRAALQRILKMNDADGLLVIKLDRFSRDEADAHLLKRAFDKAGKYILCTDEPINTSEPYGDIIYGLLVSLAAAEYKTIVQRFKKGRREAVEQGRDLTSVPGFGYKKEGKGRDALIVENPDEYKTLEIIRAHIARGRNNLQISDRLNERGIPSRTGKSWSPQAIHKIRKREDKIKSC